MFTTEPRPVEQTTVPISRLNVFVIACVTSTAINPISLNPLAHKGSQAHVTGEIATSHPVGSIHENDSAVSPDVDDPVLKKV